MYGCGTPPDAIAIALAGVGAGVRKAPDVAVRLIGGRLKSRLPGLISAMRLTVLDTLSAILIAVTAHARSTSADNSEASRSTWSKRS